MFKAARETLLQAYPNAPWRGQVQLFGYFAVGVAVVALVAGIYLYVSVSAATLGRQTQEIQREILDLQRTNADLETHLAELTSAAVMENRALEMGFQPVFAPELRYVEVPGYRDRQPASLAPPAGPVTTPDTRYPDALNQSLFDWLQEKIFEPAGETQGFNFFGSAQAAAQDAP